MAIIKDVRLFWLKANPDRPVKLGEDDDGNPRMGWEVELRTEDKEQAAEWRKEFKGGKAVRAVREDKDDEESPIMFYRWRLRRNQMKADGTKAEAPEILRGDTGENMDPMIVGNESLADVRIYTRSYDRDGTTNYAHYFLGASIKELHRYEPQEREEFETVKTMKVVDPDGDDSGDAGTKALEKADTPKSGRKSSTKKKTTPADLDDEIPF